MERELLENTLCEIVYAQDMNNNEYSYYQVMLCMLELSDYFISQAPPAISASIAAAKEYWDGYCVGENWPKDIINIEHWKLFDYIKNKRKDKSKRDITCARAAQFLTLTFSTENPDYNYERLSEYVNLLLKLGVKASDIIIVMNRYLDKI